MNVSDSEFAKAISMPDSVFSNCVFQPQNEPERFKYNTFNVFVFIKNIIFNGSV
jgi:hypothetical protein